MEKIIKSGKFTMSTSIKPAKVFIIAISTSLNKEKRLIDLEPLKDAIISITKVLRDNNLAIVESTFTPRTTLNLVKSIFDKTEKNYYLLYCPDCVLFGNLIHELIHNDRIIDGINKKSVKRAATMYNA